MERPPLEQNPRQRCRKLVPAFDHILSESPLSLKAFRVLPCSRTKFVRVSSISSKTVCNSVHRVRAIQFTRNEWSVYSMIHVDTFKLRYQSKTIEGMHIIPSSDIRRREHECWQIFSCALLSNVIEPASGDLAQRGKSERCQCFWMDARGVVVIEER